jgi:hypothetical protein
MSSEILRKTLPVTTGSEIKKDLVVQRYARANGEPFRCGYTILVGNQVVDLDGYQMREFVDTLKVFFLSEGYL